MIDRRVLLNSLKLIYETVDKVNLSWRVGEIKNEIWIRIENERRSQISEYHRETDVVLEIKITYIFEAGNIDNVIEDKRILMIQKLMQNKINLISSGFYLQDEMRVLTGALDDNTGFVELTVEFKYKDDIY